MTPTMTPVSRGSPLWKAWEAYKQSDEYANTRRWALYAEHVDGSLWAAFERGFADRLAALQGAPSPSLVALSAQWRREGMEMIGQVGYKTHMLFRCADELDALASSGPPVRSQVQDEKADTRMDTPKVTRDDSRTAAESDVSRALRALGRGIRMLGVMRSEHPQSETYNEALKLAAAYVEGFIGREENLR